MRERRTAPLLDGRSHDEVMELLASLPLFRASRFGAGVALYVPGLLLVGLPRSSLMPWARALTALAAVPFAAVAVEVFAGQPVAPTSALPGIGYLLLSLAALGWMVRVAKGDPGPPEPAGVPA